MATYTIKSGDTLSSIAKANKTTVAALASANNIKDVNKIYAGKSLNLGGSTASSSASSNTSSGKSSGGGGSGGGGSSRGYADNYGMYFSTPQAAATSNAQNAFYNANPNVEPPTSKNRGQNDQAIQQYVKDNPMIGAPTQKVEINQPSPSTVNANPFTDKTLAEKYKTGLENATSSGATPPPSGAGDVVVSSYLPQNQPDTSYVDNVLSQDGTYQQFLKDYQDYNDVVNQRDSLVDTYDQMIKDAGITKLNKQLINAKKIIDGTEDDIRTEITKAGGFATESQVQAMTNARNKTLIANYNTLLETKQAAMEQVNTMIGLAEKDRTAAIQSITTKLNLDSQLIDYAQKMQTNAQNSYQKIVDSVGYNGLYQMTGGDPYYTNLVEKTLGLGSGGLSKLASQPNIDQQIKQAQLYGQNLQNKKLLNEISGGGGGKSITSTTALNIADSKAASNMLSSLKDSIINNSDLFGPLKGRITGLNPYNTRGQDLQSLINSTKQIVGKYLEGGVLRAEDEAKYAKIIPKITDTPQTALVKLSNVQTLVDSKIEAQRQSLGGAGFNTGAITSGTIVVGPDGNEYEITN